MDREELNRILAPHLQDDELKRVLDAFDSLASPALAEYVRKWIETFRESPAADGILRMCNEAIEWRNDRDRYREESERKYTILKRYRRRVIELQTDVWDLVAALKKVAEQGPIERFGSNVPTRCVEWVIVVRAQATKILGEIKKRQED